MRTGFQYHRWLGTINLILQVTLCLALFAGITHLATKNFWRVDLTQNHLYSLSQETRSYIEHLPNPVKVIVTISPDSSSREMEQLYRDVRGLLREYEYATYNSPGANIEVEFVDLFQQRKRAQLIAEEYGIEQTDLVIFASGNNQRIVFPNDLYETKDMKRERFRGETVFTSAILDVSGQEPKTIYLTSGHGEMRMEETGSARGLSELAAALEQRNFRLRYLDLTQVEKVPDDADLVMVLSPQAPFLGEEEERLRRYLSGDAGRLIAMLDPRWSHGMQDLLLDWGILVDDVLVLDTGPDFLAGSGDTILKRFGEHPITQRLVDNNLPVVFGFSRSVRPDPGRTLDDTLSVIPLIGTSETSWGERSYRQGSNFQFNPGVDLEGPLSLAAVSETSIPSHLGINIPSGRMIVFGNSDFVSNGRINSLGNLTFMMNTINWAIDRDNLINIPPRPIDKIQLVLSGEQVAQLRITLLGILPGIVALMGITVYWIRRK